MKFAASILVSASFASIVLVGCASAVDTSAEGDDVASTDEAGESADALKAADLVGAWTLRGNGPPPGTLGLPFLPRDPSTAPPPGALGLPILPADDAGGPPPGAVGIIVPNDDSSGPPPGALGLPIRIQPKIKAIVFAQAGTTKTFFADVDTGMIPVCAAGTVDCSAKPVRVEGTYKVRGSKLTLSSTTPSGDFIADDILGQYTVALANGRLKLTNGGVTQTLNQKVSYCATVRDCGRQSLIVPACIGSFTCAAERCGFRCGIAVDTDGN
ncbi:MAG: hypothetical protein U0169_06185 [Polyangiaceae bacterium]